MLVRLGIPTSFNRFTLAARELGAPILVSANALREQDRFRRPGHGLFSGVPVALDSAGFVAMFKYGGFPWTVGEYVSLAASYPWEWWAAMDYCCEPEIAADQGEVERRQRETVRMLAECRAEATKQGINPPMPVLQGWAPADYLRCADMLGTLPPLVGLGSVCRRNLSGPAGLLAVLETLDSELPKNVRLHMFGVKGTAVAKLAGHPRVHSIDSMAWDMAVRHSGEAPTMTNRVQAMRDWYKRQIASLPQGAHGRDQPKDSTGAGRQQRKRQAEQAAGLQQVSLSLPRGLVDLVDSQKRPGENRSATVERILRSGLSSE